MLLLLPPSEGKAPPRRRGGAVQLEGLSWPELTAARDHLLDLLAAVSAEPDALIRLGVGASLAHEVEANRHLRRTPTMPVGELFTGVLYDALDLAGLDSAARRRANRQVLVSSALWGVLRLGDRVPPYRLSITADLPGIPGLSSWWRPHLRAALAPVADRGVVVDCRSAGYAAMWSPEGALAQRWVTIQVLREIAGRRTVVSHLAKLTRGQLARHLLDTGAAPRSPAELARLAGEAFEVELTEPTRPGRPWVLDIVLHDTGPSGRP